MKVKTKKTNTRSTTKTPIITKPNTVLRALNKLQKYKNGVKCNRENDERYGEQSDYTGHLLFRDVIAIIQKYGPKTTSKKSTRRR